MLQKQVKSINRHGPFYLKTFVFFPDYYRMCNANIAFCCQL